MLLIGSDAANVKIIGMNFLGPSNLSRDVVGRTARIWNEDGDKPEQERIYLGK